MKDPRFFVEEMSEFQYRLSCGINLVRAIHECLEHGNNVPEDYYDALFGAYCYLSSLDAELQDAIQAKAHYDGKPSQEDQGLRPEAGKGAVV